MTSKNNSNAERSTRDVPLILTHYQALANRGFAPLISYADRWGKYIEVADASPEQFSDYESYYEAFPLDIEVQEEHNQLAVTRNGTGGYSRWLCRYIPQENGPGWVILIFQEAEPEFPETLINAFLAEDGLPEETDSIIPSLSPALFFNSEEAKSLSEMIPMVSMWMEFGEGANELRIVPVVNQMFTCVEGLPPVQTLTEEQKKAVCVAWDAFDSTVITLHLNHQKGTYSFDH